MSYEERLDRSKSFEDIYRIVKQVVMEKYGLRRGGMGLVLASLPNEIAAYHEIGSNAIVLNASLLKAVSSVAKSKKILNSYVFVVLLHEYLHTLGFDERQTRELVRETVTTVFPPDHPATRIATQTIYDVLPELRNLPQPSVISKPLLIRDFDTDNVKYIG
jgi:hypothetical protein